MPPLLANKVPLTLTLIGRRSRLPEKTFLYEVGYYIEPLEGSFRATIALLDDRGREEIILSDLEVLPGGISDFLSVEQARRYTLVRLTSPDLDEPVVVKLHAS